MSANLGEIQTNLNKARRLHRNAMQMVNRARAAYDRALKNETAFAKSVAALEQSLTESTRDIIHNNA